MARRHQEHHRQDPELDIHLTLPAPGPTQSSSSRSQPGPNDALARLKDDQRPIVVLLGWAGCQDRYLAKYSAIYEERGCTTIRFTAPVESLFWKTWTLPVMGRRLVEAVLDRCPNSRQAPVFCHVFSNGGAIVYKALSQALAGSGTPLQVRGVIFDSAPGSRRLSSLFRAISAIIGGHPLVNLPVSFGVTLVISLFWLAEIVGHAVAGSGAVVWTDPMALRSEAYSWPQLFLYSDADSLIRSADVERFARQRAERGVPTRLVLFTGSPHVKHFAMYREVYVQTVCQFMLECLASRRASQPANESTSESALPLSPERRIVLTREASFEGDIEDDADDEGH